MADAGQVSAFMDSGRRDGVLHYIYLFHALMSLPQIRPGDVVLDLACGPANQLLQIARLHPDCRFVGLDASPAMLQLAADNLRAAGVGNVSLQQGDMTVLAGVADRTVDVVLCTMSLHHLPDVSALQQTLLQVRRILRPMAGCIWQILAGSSAGPPSITLPMTAARCSRYSLPPTFFTRCRRPSAWRSCSRRRVPWAWCWTATTPRWHPSWWCCAAGAA
jgi:ubiquinone/menaquinone biosynthesis C-methylase UbiE